MRIKHDDVCIFLGALVVCVNCVDLGELLTCTFESFVHKKFV